MTHKPMTHKPDCASKRQCLVYHGEGVSCPNPYPCDCSEVKEELDNEHKMQHKGMTHYACQERLDKFGGKTIGCCCNGHDCEPSVPSKPQPKKEKRCPECQVDQPETYGHTMTCSKREDPVKRFMKTMNKTDNPSKPQPKEWELKLGLLMAQDASAKNWFNYQKNIFDFVSSLLSRQKKEILKSLLEKLPKEEDYALSSHRYKSAVIKIIKEEIK